MAELFSTVSLATSMTSEGWSAPNSMLLLSRILSSGPRTEAGTAGTGSGIKTSSGASGNGLGWTAGSWGATMAGVEVGRTLVEQVFLGTALLTRIGTRRCSLWQDCLGTSSHLVRGSDWQISSATVIQDSFGTETQLSSGCS